MFSCLRRKKTGSWNVPSSGSKINKQSQAYQSPSSSPVGIPDDRHNTTVKKVSETKPTVPSTPSTVDAASLDLKSDDKENTSTNGNDIPTKTDIQQNTVRQDYSNLLNGNSKNSISNENYCIHPDESKTESSAPPKEEKLVNETKSNCSHENVIQHHIESTIQMPTISELPKIQISEKIMSDEIEDSNKMVRRKSEVESTKQHTESDELLIKINGLPKDENEDSKKVFFSEEAVTKFSELPIEQLESEDSNKVSEVESTIEKVECDEMFTQVTALPKVVIENSNEMIYEASEIESVKQQKQIDEMLMKIIGLSKVEEANKLMSGTPEIQPTKKQKDCEEELISKNGVLETENSNTYTATVSNLHIPDNISTEKLFEDGGGQFELRKVNEVQTSSKETIHAINKTSDPECYKMEEDQSGMPTDIDVFAEIQPSSEKSQALKEEFESLTVRLHSDDSSEILDIENDTEFLKNVNVKRRSGLAGHAANVEKHDLTSLEIVKHPKEKSDEKLIKDAIANNDFLQNLFEGPRLQAVVDAMYSRHIKSKEIIIHEGSVGTQLYISASGKYEVMINGEAITNFNDTRVFGELAILYNAKRQATIQALSSGRVWVLDQIVYQQLMLRSEIEHHDQLLNFLRNVPKLNTVSNRVLGRVADLLKREFFCSGNIIVQQGNRGDKFYIIGAGCVSISKEDEGDVGKMGRGEFFGQLALLKDDVRQATVTADAPGVECFSLSRVEFIEHFGNVENIEDIPENPKRKSTEPIVNIYQDIDLLDLKKIGTLGVGGFGRVELVQHKTQKDLTFALKYLKKIDMIQQQQQEHALNEKRIQMGCDSIFIVRMYKTFRDKKYLYFLMESCLGGDLWSLLQKQRGRRFEETAARFYAASVLEALAYLHERCIIYRDLKPENLLLDTRGYLKLTDFGFAKKLGLRGKTYTFAGTPEYVTPETVLNRGHDKAVDYWALGVFIFELLVGRTPFRSNDTSYMKTYNLILRGIDNVRFPETVPRKAENLIKKLCKSMATERLGCQKDGPQAVRDHKWFVGLDWNQLYSCQLKAPFKRPVDSNIDIRNFDKYEKDTDIPPDEMSGWDINF